MRTSTLAGIGAMFLAIAAPARAQVACKLLQPAEIEAALQDWSKGGKAGAPQGAFDKSSGISMDTCTTEIVRPKLGNLVVSTAVMKDLPMDGADLLRIQSKSSASEGQWHVAGAKFEQKDVGSAICTQSGRPSVAAHTVCAIPRGKSYVQVNVQSPTQAEMASFEAVAGLVQKASGRL